MPDADPAHYRLNDLKLRWQQDPSSRLFLQLADEHRKLGQHEEAVAVLEQGLEHRPNDLSALVALGRCRLELERVEEAIEPLEAVVGRDPTHMVASKLLLEAHLQRGDAEKAGKRLETYRLLNDRDPELDHLQYRLDRLRSEHEEAPTAVGGTLEPEDAFALEPEGAIELEPEDAFALEPEGAIELEPEEPEGAIELEPEDAFALEAEGAIELEPDEAIEPEPLAMDEPPAAEAGPVSGEIIVEAAPATAEQAEPPPPEAAEEIAGAPASAEVAAEAPERPAAEAQGSAVAADPFELSSDLPPVPDLGALWEQASRQRSVVSEPFLGLAALDAEHHWQLLSREGIFAAPDLPAGNGAAAVAAAAPELKAPEAVVEEPKEASREPEIVAEPEPEPEPEPEVAVEPDDLMATEPEVAVESEALTEPEIAVETVAAEPEVAAEAIESAAEPEEPTDLAAAALVGVAAVAAAAAAVTVRSTVADEPADDVPPAIEPADLAPPAIEPADLAPPAIEPADLAAEEADADLAPAVVEQADLAADDLEPAADEAIEEPATATLGELYLKQGHHEEAERIFRRVLAKDPRNPAALDGLARLGKRRSKPLSAADLLAVKSASGRIPEGLTAKKVLILGNYVQHLKAAAQSHVS